MNLGNLVDTSVVCVMVHLSILSKIALKNHAASCHAACCLLPAGLSGFQYDFLQSAVDCRLQIARRLGRVSAPWAMHAGLRGAIIWCPRWPAHSQKFAFGGRDKRIRKVGRQLVVVAGGGLEEENNFKKLVTITAAIIVSQSNSIK